MQGKVPRLTCPTAPYRERPSLPEWSGGQPNYSIYGTPTINTRVLIAWGNREFDSCEKQNLYSGLFRTCTFVARVSKRKVQS